MSQHGNIPFFLKRYEHFNEVVIAKIREGKLGNDGCSNAGVESTLGFSRDVVLLTKVGN